MNIISFKSLWDLGLPIWIVTLGGLACMLLDSLLSRPAKAVFSTALAFLAGAIWMVFRKIMMGANGSVDLLLVDNMTLFFIVLVLGAAFFSVLNTYSYLRSGGADNAISSPTLPGGIVTLIMFAVVGQIFLFASDHLIVNFIGLETMSLAIYILVGSNRKDTHSNEAAMKYFVLGSVASAVFLYGVALWYGATGSFQLSKMDTGGGGPLMWIGSALMLGSFLFKIGLVPFHFWVADVYEGAPTPVTGFMATGVKIASLGLVMRVIATPGLFPFELVHKILEVVVILTLVIGNLAAIMQENIKRMLAYSSISHAGYLFFGILVGFQNGHLSAEASGAVVFYLLSYTLMSLGVFAVLSMMVKDGREVTQFSDLSGLGYQHPALALVFSVFLVALLGFPPTIGFIAKYVILSQAIAQGYIYLAVLAVVTTIISAYYYLRPLVVMYFRGPEVRHIFGEVPLPLMFSVIFCLLGVIYIGLFPDDYLKLSSLVSLAINK